MSTEGTQALESILIKLPATTPPILIVQHLPDGFSDAFASRLNGIFQLEVKVAQDNDLLQTGRVLIAPGAKHMTLNRTSLGLSVRVKAGPKVCRHCPSIDVLFRYINEVSGLKILTIMMTGMGDDGARGIKSLRDNKVTTVAQDEASCVVFGMPKAAIALKSIDYILPLNETHHKIISNI